MQPGLVHGQVHRLCVRRFAFIPRSSVLDLYDALRQPKRIVWLESAHVATSEEEVVDELMAITLDWMAERGLR